jgi:PAS domain S-box-containing protein
MMPNEIPAEVASRRDDPEALVVVDISGSIVLMTPAAEELFGIDQESIAGEALELLLPEHLRFGHQAYRRAYFMEPTPRQMDPGLEPAAESPMTGDPIPVEVFLEPLQVDGKQFVAAHVSRRETS